MVEVARSAGSWADNRRYIAAFVLRATAAALVLLLCARLLAGLPLGDMIHVLAAASPLLIAAANLTHIVALLSRVGRWRILLSPVKVIPASSLSRYIVATHSAVMLVPTRAGELVGVWALADREGIPVVTCAACVLADKLFEGIGLMLVVAPLPWLLPLPRPAAITTEALVVGGMLVTAAALVIARTPSLEERVERLPGCAGIGVPLEAFRKPSAFLACSSLAVGAHLFDVCAIVVLFAAAGLHVPWAAAPLLKLALNVVFLVPAAPGQIGSFELGVVAPLLLIGADRTRAAAFAILFHLVMLLPAVLGLLWLVPLILARKGERRGAPEGVPDASAPGA
jgi:uncharacterized membrane protein YbhN (UPF0104 family)